MPKRLEKKYIRRPYRKNPKKKGALFQFFLFLFLLFAIGAVALGIKLQKLEKEVEKRFSALHRWNIPSRIFSDNEYLYPGVDVARRDLKVKLGRLGYRAVPAIKGPGDYVWEPSLLQIHLHDFTYPQEKFFGFPVKLELKEGKIARIVDLESGEELTLLRLEPEEIATIFDEKMEDRTLITLKDCPDYLLEAVILIEDERFFKHKGVDPIAIFRAVAADILTFKLSQGGSTLTQQLVKNYFLTSEKSLERKLNEALMAIVIEMKYTKGEILEAYLNEIYLGQRGPSSVTGVAEAAKHYFAKDVHQITVAEAALLAGMIRFPSRYSPLNSKERAKERRDFVLKRMREYEVIDEPTYQTALAEVIITPTPKSKPVVVPYFIDFLKQQLSALYPQGVLQTEGLKIFTTLDMSMQTRGEEILKRGLANLEKQYAGQLPKDHAEALQGCLVALTPQNGYVRAMVGGREYGGSQFNRCAQALRQPGSTFKPFVYLTALDPARSRNPFTAASLLEDTRFSTPTAQGPWSPQNYDEKEHGTVTLRRALEQSYNIATAKLALETGLEEIVQTARDAGITSPLSPVPSLALGSFEVTPLEMAGAYSIFPNKGLRSQALSVINVMTPKGEVLEKKTLKIKRVFEAAPVALMNEILKGVFERGTASSAKALGFEGIAAGKTGTTSNYRDAWFVGFTPDMLSLVWVGYDDNATLNLSGGKAALPIWLEFMKAVAGKPLQDFSFPPGIVQVNIDPDTGRLAGPECSRQFKEYFIQGTEPEEVCSHAGGKEITPALAFPSGEEPGDSGGF